MPFEEYKDYARELNKQVDEWKRIEALPNNNIREMAALPPESVQVPEQSSQINPEPEIDKLDLDSNDIGNKSDRFDENDNKVDSGKRDAQGQSDNNNRINNTINNDNTTINSGMQTAEVAEAGTSSVVSSSAVLTGGVTVISACVAVAVVSVGASIMNKAPKIVSCNIQTGADYLVYEINVDDLDYSNDSPDSKTQYKIRVHNDFFVMDFPIEQAGMQTQIVTGLIPFRRYTVSVVGTSVIGDFNYYSVNCYTSKLKKPRAVFEFTPKIDYKAGLYDVEYKAYISDYYNTGSDTYLKVYVGDTLAIEQREDELDSDGFFKGVLTNMPNGVKISAQAFTTYYDEKDLLIGEYGYVVQHPEDFVKNQFLSEYTFNEDSMESSFDSSSLTYTLDVDTQFNNEGYPNESYRIDLYNYGELVDSITTKDKKVSFNLPSYINNVEVKLTELLGNAEVGTKTIPYVMDPKLFSTEFRFLEDDYSSYYIEFYANSDAFILNNNNGNGTGGGKINFINDISDFDPDLMTYTLTEYYKDGSSNVKVDSQEGGIDTEGNYIPQGKEFDHVIVEVKFEDILVGRYRYDIPDYKVEIADVEVDDYGNVYLPYEVKADDFYLDEILFSSENAYVLSENEITGKTGTIKLDYLKTNNLSGSLVLCGYDKSGTKTEVTVPFDTINLNARIETDTYVAYYSSQLKINALLNPVVDIDGVTKPIKIDLGIEQWGFDHYDDDAGEAVYDYQSVSTSDHITGMYYDFTVSQDTGYFKYRITAPGFDETNLDNEVQIDLEMVRAYSQAAAELYQFNLATKTCDFLMLYNYIPVKSAISYVKTTNSDGTVNYYFYTNLEDETNTHKLRIRYVYKDGEGKDRAEYTDFFTGKYYALENMPDIDYDFYCMPYYEKNNDIYEVDTYNCLLLDETTFIDYKSSSINVIEESSTEITLKYDMSMVDKNNMNISYLGETYNIPFYTEDSSEIETVEYRENYSRVGYSYSNERDNYSYSCIVYDSGLIKVTLNLFNVGDEILSSNLPKLKTTIYPDVVGKIGSNNIKNYEQLNKGQMSLDIFTHTQVSPDDYYSSVGAEQSGIRLYCEFGNVNFIDDRDSIMIYVLDENRQVIRKIYPDNNYIETMLPTYTEKLIIQTVLLKKTVSGEESSYIEFNVIDEQEYVVSELFETTGIPINILSNPTFNAGDSNIGYSFEADINDTTDSYQNADYHYEVRVYEYMSYDEEKETWDYEGNIVDLYNLSAISETNLTDLQRVEIEVVKVTDSNETVWARYVQVINAVG